MRAFHSRLSGPALRGACGLLLAAALAACASAVQQDTPEPAAPPSHSVQEAQRRLDAAAAERAAVQAEFAASEQICYTRFFVTRCLDAAKEKRREALARVRAIEVEAEHYKRLASVQERDRALAATEKKFEQEQARLAAEPPKPSREASALPEPRRTPAERAAEHAARMKQLDAKDQAGAARRAEKARAYEQRRLQSEQRQRDIAAKKAKAEKEQASKAH